MLTVYSLIMSSFLNDNLSVVFLYDNCTVNCMSTISYAIIYTGVIELCNNINVPLLLVAYDIG